MASRGHERTERTTEAYGVSGFTGCSKTPQPETRDNLQTPSQGSGPRAVPAAAANCGSCLRRNVVSERERRRRISLSCERLRGLLPHFDGRREDMASVLEMAVHFLQLAHSMAPGWEQLSVAQPSQEMWHMWQGDVVQVTLADQMEDSKPEPGIAKASGAARAQDPPCCGTLGMDQKPDTERMSELLERSSSPDEPSSLSPEPSSLSPGLSPWLPHSWQLASPQTSDIISGGLHPVGSLARDTESPGILAEETNLVLTSVPDARYATGAGSDVMDGTPFLLATNPDWWLGSVEGRGGPTLSMSSPMERAEASFVGDPEPSSQELHAGPVELWGLDFGSPGLALKDEADSIFPDFFPC
ncbi:spermatogenesis- and oogenesis-specific basic helix-loop-helix-containing protein 1 isoform X1 [Alexandromys fortis]|uniref:spermatogenesis- and oogenesis-specific basic helix-loop-helix-containing protein 1 isoform X1 n=1 Tax=Alexandromys fortis TaxID=100897 RepID=UPI0021525AB3|nr:spermatogenesis- and oogenesis-specific basic helix-loop-helix-containing protein 1 isoform X1 [Microtus fortis]XP_050011214.1 spermatogenesis- and oogenesis-specific basic helix-loop-helix-containing protein 1 isoform X1 [Microtus fortis]